MKKGLQDNHIQVDWGNIHDNWYIAGFGTVQLDELMFCGGGNPNWTKENLDALFLNKAKIQANHRFPIRWQAFDEKYGSLVFRLGRNQILRAVLAFSKDETSIQATYDFYTKLNDKLGVQLADHGDNISSALPDFYYDSRMTAEDFFFDQFISTGLTYTVTDPVKFATWVLNDYRWRALVTVYSI